MLIELKNVTKCYPHCVSLSGINLSVNAGQFVAITGESGSGKSTLLSVMSGLNKPTSGSVFVNDRDLYSLSDKELSAFRNRKIGFIFQNFFLAPEYTVVQNVELPLLIGGFKDDLSTVCERELTNVGLWEKRNEKISALSGGEKQRCAFARAMVTNPDIIFADEPCGNLDSKNREVLMSYFKAKHEEGKTIILVTHNIEETVFSDRIITLKDGRISSDVYRG